MCTAIERHPFDIEPVVDRVRELRDADPDCSVVIDAEGLGDAAWQLLDRPRRKRRFRLYEKHGIERAELTRELLVAVARKSIRFPADVPGADAMKSALLGLSRDVREDGPGSELCVALPWRSPTGRGRRRVCMAGRDRRRRRCDLVRESPKPYRDRSPPRPPRGRAHPALSSSRPFRMTNRHDGQSAPCYECECVSRCAHAVAGNVKSRWCVPALEGLRDTLPPTKGLVGRWGAWGGRARW